MRPADTAPASSTADERRNPRKSGLDCQESAPLPNTVLLIDHDAIHSQPLIECLTTHRLGVDLCANIEQAAKKLRLIGGNYELVIVNISDVSQPWLRLLSLLRESVIESGVAVAPDVLCVSTAKYDALFELQIERMAGRLVYER